MLKSKRINLGNVIGRKTDTGLEGLDAGDQIRV